MIKSDIFMKTQNKLILCLTTPSYDANDDLQNPFRTGFDDNNHIIKLPIEAIKIDQKNQIITVRCCLNKNDVKFWPAFFEVGSPFFALKHSIWPLRLVLEQIRKTYLKSNVFLVNETMQGDPAEDSVLDLPGMSCVALTDCDVKPNYDMPFTCYVEKYGGFLGYYFYLTITYDKNNQQREFLTELAELDCNFFEKTKED